MFESQFSVFGITSPPPLFSSPSEGIRLSDGTTFPSLPLSLFPVSLRARLVTRITAVRALAIAIAMATPAKRKRFLLANCRNLSNLVSSLFSREKMGSSSSKFCHSSPVFLFQGFWNHILDTKHIFHCPLKLSKVCFVIFINSFPEKGLES